MRNPARSLGDDPAEVAALLARAIALVGEQGSHAIGHRATVAAERLGVAVAG
jgi:hypothetical protein